MYLKKNLSACGARRQCYSNYYSPGATCQEDDKDGDATYTCAMEELRKRGQRRTSTSRCQRGSHARFGWGGNRCTKSYFMPCNFQAPCPKNFRSESRISRAQFFRIFSRPSHVST